MSIHSSIASLSLTAAALAFASASLGMPPSPRSPNDCNQNGIDDAIDIALATSPDSNFNNIPDECEFSIQLVYQDSFPGPGTGWLLRHSDRGEMRVRVIDPPDDRIWWLTVGGPGRWYIYNFPITESDGAGMATDRTIPFRIGAPGVEQVDIEIVELRLSSTPMPVPPAPPPAPSAPPLFNVPVIEHVLRVGNLGPITTQPVLPMLGIDPIFFDANGQPKEFVRRREVPGLSERTNECGPGAAARSLEWLRTLYCIDYPDNNDTLAEIMTEVSSAMGYTFPAGVVNAQTAFQGVRDWISFNDLDDHLSAMAIEDGDPNLLFNALKDGCDVVGVMYFLQPDGSDRLSHAVTVTGASKCGNDINIFFRDDSHGGDLQNDGQPDANSSKSGRIIARPNPPGGWTLEGYGDNRWAGFIKICPTRKVQLDAANKWNTMASGDPEVGGFRQLVERIVAGAAVSEQDRMNLLKWSCNLVDTMEFAHRQIIPCTPSPGAGIANEMRGRARAAKSAVWVYLRSGNPEDLAVAAEEIGVSFEQFYNALSMLLDCNHNGIDDANELARGLAHDANHDCKLDECQCLADWNSSGGTSAQDIFDFLRDFFGGSADFNHDGSTSPQDLFDFLRAWFMGCGG